MVKNVTFGSSREMKSFTGFSLTFLALFLYSGVRHSDSACLYIPFGIRIKLLLERRTPLYSSKKWLVLTLVFIALVFLSHLLNSISDFKDLDFFMFNNWYAADLGWRQSNATPTVINSRSRYPFMDTPCTYTPSYTTSCTFRILDRICEDRLKRGYPSI